MADVNSFASINVPYIPFSDGVPHPGLLEETKSLKFARKADPDYVIRNHRVNHYLSDAQLDAVALACQSFETILQDGSRQGFLLGDGAGVGKNRQNLGILAEVMFVQKRLSTEPYTAKAVILTCSNALFEQTKKDLAQLSVEEQLFSLNTRYETVVEKPSGILFATYSLLTTSGAVSRIDQMCNWLGADFDGIIILDECHMAKRYSEIEKESTLTGDKVVELQNRYPLARVLYSSATGLSTINHVGYLQRLGMFGPGTPFYNASDFIAAAKDRGVAGMEMLTVELRSRGVYLARTLSFKGVGFSKIKCEMDPILYNQSTLLWTLLYKLLKSEDKVSPTKTSQYWQSHQRYFSALLLACKINPVVLRSIQEKQRGKSIVIGLQSTGESGLRETINEDTMNDETIYSAAKSILTIAMKKAGIQACPEKEEKAPSDKKLKKLQEIHDNEKDGPLIEWIETDWNFKAPSNIFKPVDEKKVKQTQVKEKKNKNSEEEIEKNRLAELFVYQSMLKKKIMRQYRLICTMFGTNPLDDLIEKLGGDTLVAEMTGRSLKREKNFDGEYENLSRKAYSNNMNDYQEFMNGAKKYAIISEAFSTGISLHNEIKEGNEDGYGARVHITIEFSWSPDRVIQQFGRTHRSNQNEPPTYVLAVSNVPGEERFLGSISEKLKLLGALTRGDQSANNVTSNISTLDFNPTAFRMGITNYVHFLNRKAGENKRDAATLKMLKMMEVVYKTTKEYKVNTAFKAPAKFMNRLLGMPIKIQEWILDGIVCAIEEYKDTTKDKDSGIKDYHLGHGVSATVLDKEDVGNNDGLNLQLYTIEVEKVTDWQTAIDLLDKYHKAEMLQTDTGPAIAIPKSNGTFLVYRPYNCDKEIWYTFEKLKHRQIRTTSQLEKLWRPQLSQMFKNPGMCAHEYQTGRCKYEGCGNNFKAKYQLYVLSGPLSSVWKQVSDAVHGKDTTKHLEAIRISAKVVGRNNMEDIVGVVVPLSSIGTLKKNILELLIKIIRDMKDGMECESD